MSVRLIVLVCILIITSCNSSNSGSNSSPATPVQPQISITMDLHCDPLSQMVPVDERRTIFRQQVANTTWFLDFLEPYGVKVSFLAVGECYEFCMDDSESAACLPLLRRLQASGGILGTHQHADYYRGAHDWPTIPNAYTTPSATDVRRVWDSGKQFTDNAIRRALGLTDPESIAAINTAAESHAKLADPNQLMKEYGYTIREGGGDQDFAAYFSHVPWNPFRPGATTITEDLTTPFVTVPQGMVIGTVGEHKGIWQDGTAGRKKAEFLQLYANWKERNRTGVAPNVWSFGWGVHTQDLNEGSGSRAAIMELIPWLHDEFTDKADATGRPPARFASYIDVRNEYQAWEAEHPGVSSFNYAAATTDYSRYPYLAWLNRYLRYARFDSRISAAGAADVFLFKAGDYSAATPTTYPLVLASAESSAVTIDLSAIFGNAVVRNIAISSGTVTSGSAASISLCSEPLVLCLPADCDAVLALEQGSSGAACGSSTCSAGTVCATDIQPNICVPDCRVQGNACPLQHPTCNQTTGVCH